MVMMMILVIVIINHSDRGGELFVYADQDITGCFFCHLSNYKENPIKNISEGKKVKRNIMYDMR